MALPVGNFFYIPVYQFKTKFLSMMFSFPKAIKNRTKVIHIPRNYLCQLRTECKYQKIIKYIQKKSKTTLFRVAFVGPLLLFPINKPKFIEVASVIELQKPYSRDKQVIEKFDWLLFFIYEAICLFLRSLQLCLTFIPILFSFPITYLGQYPQEIWWKLLLTGIEFSGPVFIKFGQWASTRRDVFPEICCNQFARLQRRSKPHSWEHTKQQMIKAFGKNWQKVFEKFDNNSDPIGSGCVAQVYKVWVREDYIKNKELVNEIIEEMDEHEDRIGIVDDGLEVSGFRNWSWLHKTRSSEEVEALLEFKRARELKLRDKERENKELFNQSPWNFKMAAEALANNFFLCKEKSSNNCIAQPKDNYEPVADHQNDPTPEENLEHALVEQWQAAPESLEKFLPVSEEDLLEERDDLEGLVPVALKVLHPKVYRIFTRDMKILKGCSCVASFFFPSLKWLSLEQCIDEFYNVMSAQIDLRKEAEHLEKFTELFSPVETIRFPRPIRPFVTRRVLVETYEEGEPMINFITGDKEEPLKKNLAKIGVDALLKMIFTDNFIHGDLHPGNMLVQNETMETGGLDATHDGNTSKIMMMDIGVDTFVMNMVKDPKPLRICILDCGIASSLRHEDLENFRAVFHQVILGQGESVANLFLENSDHNCQNPNSFRSDMNDLIQAVRSNALSLEKVDVGLLLQKVLSMLLQHHIRLDSAFSSVVLAVFVLEGLGRSLDPEMDILERARPFLL